MFILEIRLEGIKKKYSRNKRELIVLENLDMYLPEGKFIVISGDIGVGKSTLLNIISGLSRPTKGKVFYDEKEITGLDDKAISNIRKNYLGVVTQNCELIPYLTVLENLKLAYEINKNTKSNDADSRIAFSELLNELGLLSLENEYPRNLSSGEIKRAAIVRALVTNPEVIIMDEPTANLDRQNVTNVLKLLRRYCDLGSMVVISSHEKEAYDYSDIHKNLD